MGYKDENIKHRQGINPQPKYRCPKCGAALKIDKIPLGLICGTCNKFVKGEDINID